MENRETAMRAALIGLAAASIGAASAPAAAQGRFESVPIVPDLRPTRLPYETLAYGAGPHRKVMIFSPGESRRNALVISLEGADFARESAAYSDSWIPTMLFDAGVAHAIVSHRPAHQGGIEAIVADLASGIAALVRDAARYRIDPERIVLLGSGAAGHFAALLATDPRHLEQAGVPFASIRGVVVLNGDAFDVRRRMAGSNGYRRRQYADVFGRDEAVQAAYSPIAHARAPDAPAWLFHALRSDANLRAEAEAMASALRAGGAQAEVRLVQPTRDRAATLIGTPQHPETAPLLSFLRTTLR
jgi:acetyl esterase/lipase